MKTLNQHNIKSLLISRQPEDLESLLQHAESIRLKNLGKEVHLRGLIECSNKCDRNCFYCGLRKDNHNLNRYCLDRQEIIDTAMQALDSGFYSICLQSGEIDDPDYINFLADLLNEIKELSKKADPQGKGLGITLSVGELTYYQYKKLWDAGAHRYLLRIESSDPKLFKKLHPPKQSFSKRKECLKALKEIGYQIGTGVMIGLPGQSAEHLAGDLEFFMHEDIDMLGMGPYIPNHASPLSKTKEPVLLDPYLSTVKMLAFSRILMPDINMVASTALQSITSDGLKMGLRAGANIVMPILTPESRRNDYYLYEGKKFEEPELLVEKIRSYAYKVRLWEYGDSKHYFMRTQQ